MEYELNYELLKVDATIQTIECIFLIVRYALSMFYMHVCISRLDILAPKPIPIANSMVSSHVIPFWHVLIKKEPKREEERERRRR